MPKIKRKSTPVSSAQANGPTPDVLTLSEAAAYLRLPEGEVVRLIREQGLPARQAGSEWRLLLPAIRDWLAKGKPPESNKEAWMKLVGVWKNDPFFDDFLREINRQRSLLNVDDQE